MSVGVVVQPPSAPLADEETKCSGPSRFPMWPLKCRLFYGVVSVHERERGTRSKRCNTRKSLLLMHPTLSWYSLCRMLFKCVFSKLALFLVQGKQKTQMRKPGLTLVLSLTGRTPVFDNGQTKVPGNNLLCDLFASLQGLSSKESVEKWDMFKYILAE